MEHNIQGSKITAIRTTAGRIVCRDASQFKLVNTVINTAAEQEAREEATQPIATIDEDERRSETLLNIPLTNVTSPIRRKVQTQGRSIHLRRNRGTQRQMQEEANLK